VRAVNESTGALQRGAPIHRLRAGLLLAAATVALAGCGGDDPAATNHLGFEEGVAPQTEGISTLTAVVLYGLVPLLILLLVAAAAWLPGVIRSNRYRPARGWTSRPVWFGGPADPAAAVESARVGDEVRGGASGSW
jgi:hypothetical protein